MTDDKRSKEHRNDLEKRLQASEAQCRVLRRHNQEWTAKMKLAMERKVIEVRLKCQTDKEKALAANTLQLRKAFDEKLRQAIREKERGPGAKKHQARPQAHMTDSPTEMQKIPKALQRQRAVQEDAKTRNNNWPKLQSPLPAAPANKMLNSSSSGTLPRTPKSTPVRAFGGVQSMTKDEHEKEKVRWLGKISELENALQKSEVVNSDLSQTKAELNKKIVDMEKNQRPLVDNNKKLADKNRSLMLELKKTDEKLRHSQDDYLTLRDSFERTVAENSKLREKRATPEKLDELERYKQQNMEYSKCITTLKQGAIDKDRRIELLTQKLKRLRKNRNLSSDNDENRSILGSESGSVSSMSLDTITEDFEELGGRDMASSYRQLAREHQELQRAYCSLKVNSVDGWRQRENQLLSQLRTAHSQIEQLTHALAQSGSETDWPQEKADYMIQMQKQQGKIEALEKSNRSINNQLEETREQNELLEFQVLELEHSKHEDVDLSASQIVSLTCDRSVSTSDDEAFYSMEISDNSGDEGKELSAEELKVRLTLMKHRRGLCYGDKSTLVQTKEYLERIENQHSQCDARETEWKVTIRDLETKIEAMEKDADKNGLKQTRKKHLQQEIDFLHQRLTEVEGKNSFMASEVSRTEKEMDKLRYTLVLSEETEKKERTRAENLKKELAQLTDSRSAEIELLENNAKKHTHTVTSLRDEIESLRQKCDQLESSRPCAEWGEFEKKYIETKSRLRDTMALVREYESVSRLNRIKLESKEAELTAAQTELSNIKQENGVAALEQKLSRTLSYNAQLETQFQLQMQMLAALKEQMVACKNSVQTVEWLKSVGTEMEGFDLSLDCVAQTQSIERALLKGPDVPQVSHIIHCLLLLLKSHTNASEAAIGHAQLKRHFSPLELVASESEHPASTCDDRSSSSASVPSSDSAALSPSRTDVVSHSSGADEESDSGISCHKAPPPRTQRRLRAMRRAHSAEDDSKRSSVRLSLSRTPTDKLIATWDKPVDATIVGYKVYAEGCVCGAVDVSCSSAVVDRCLPPGARVVLHAVRRNAPEMPLATCYLNT